MPSFADVSIVILARNGLLFTRHCLESLLRASVLPRQVLVVDNDSSDETPAYLAAQLPRLSAAGIAVVTWRNAENVG
jgi:glycosyltransferase involved in cell wall biosynthesis